MPSPDDAQPITTLSSKFPDGTTLNVRDIGKPLGDGTFLLHVFREDADYRDFNTGQWIWSIGKFPDGRIVAATDTRFYNGGDPNADGSTCVWLR